MTRSLLTRARSLSEHMRYLKWAWAPETEYARASDDNTVSLPPILCLNRKKLPFLLKIPKLCCMVDARI